MVRAMLVSETEERMMRGWLSIWCVAATLLAGAAGGVKAQPTDPATWQTGGRYAEISGLRFYFESHGVPATARSPVVLLHGGTAAGNTWEEQIPAFVEAGYAVIVPDLRGHGRSGDGEGPLTYERLIDDIVELLDTLRIPAAHLVGWSMGGAAALHLAIKYPSRVASLGLLGTPHSSDGLSDSMRERLRTVSPYDWAPVAVDYYRAHAPNPDHWPVLFEKVRSLVLSEWRITPEALAGLTVPVLLIAGLQDDVVPAEHQLSAARWLRDTDVLALSGVGHFPHHERPHEVNRAVLEFLDRSRR